MVEAHEITHVEALENYTKVHLKEGEPCLMRRTIQAWEDLLPRDLFLRAERSLIVQWLTVTERKPESGKVWVARLTGQKQPLKLGPQAASRLRQVCTPANNPGFKAQN